jgi:hypothetical protein
MGRLRVVSRPTSSSKKSARWVSWNGMSAEVRPAASVPTFPAPVYTCREMKWGITWVTIRENGTCRSIR